MKKYDVIIIGAGVIGCAVAERLSRLRLSVAVLERAHDVAEGTSKANTGLVHAGFDAVPGSLKARFNVAGARMFEDECRRLGVHYSRAGALVAAFDDAQRQTLRKLLERGEQNGVEQLRIVEGEELFELEPNLSRQAVAALYAPTAALVCPYGLTCAYADSAAINGVKFEFGCEVIAIKRAQDGYAIATSCGEYEAGCVVNAAGLHSDELNNMVSSHKIKITPRRGEYWMVDRAFEGLFRHSVFPTPTEMGKGILVTPTVDGTLMVGPTATDIDDKDDVSTTSQQLDRAFEGARKIWPEISRSCFITSFAGNRATCDRGDFVIGEAPDAPGFFNAVGIESPGLSSAPAIARYIAGLVAEMTEAEPRLTIAEYVPPIKPLREMNDEERAQAIAENRDYGRIVCRCETITEAEVRDAIRRPVGARSIDAVKRRTRSGMGRCQGGFCSPRVAEILCEELGISMLEVSKRGGASTLLTGLVGEEE